MRNPLNKVTVVALNTASEGQVTDAHLGINEKDRIVALERVKELIPIMVYLNDEVIGYMIDGPQSMNRLQIRVSHESIDEIRQKKTISIEKSEIGEIIAVIKE